VLIIKDGIEIVLHGRGGQGAKSAGQIIAETALMAGKQIQAFPEYGPERAGAPTKSFVRISDRKIRTYAPITEPDIVMVIDPTLLDAIDITEGLTKESILIINSGEPAEELRKKIKEFEGKIYSVDATSISLGLLGKNLPNMPILGALVKVTDFITIKDLEKSVKDHFLSKIGEQNVNKNIDGIRKAYEEVTQ